MASATTTSRPLPSAIPIFVGVSGHRDLRSEDLPLLEAQVAQIFQDVKAKHPHSPLAVLSPLAEGADQLVARVGLAAGASLYVPLPLSQEEYENDFDTEASLQAFRALLSQAAGAFVVEDGMLGQAVPKATAASSPRDLAYTRAGFFVALNAHVFLALWDGQPSNKPAGTAGITRFRLEGSHPLLPASEDLMVVPETGPVIQVVTPRVSGGEVPRDPGSLLMRVPTAVPTSKAPAQLVDASPFLDLFNQDLQDLPEVTPEGLNASIGSLFPEGLARKAGEEDSHSLAMFGHCDLLAQAFQRNYDRCLFGTFGLAGVAFIALETFGHKYPEQGWVLMLFVASLAVAGALVWIAGRQQWQRKYLDYRALAEALRIQIYWDLAGVRQDLASGYLSSQVEELAWTRMAMRAVRIPSYARPRATNADGMALPVISHWLKDQEAFFGKRQRRIKKQGQRLHLLSNFAFAACLFLAFLLALKQWGCLLWVSPSSFLTLTCPFPEPHSNHLLHGWIVAITSALVVSALVHGYHQKRAYHELANQYKRMEALCRRALAALKCARELGDAPNVEAVLRRIGREALVENADWVLLHRVRPLEVPKP